MSAVFIAATCAALLISAVVRAYVIAELWGWYMVSAFSLPPITMSTAFGISLLASLFMPTTTPPKSEEHGTAEQVGKLIGLFIGQLVVYVFALILGAVVHEMASSP